MSYLKSFIQDEINQRPSITFYKDSGFFAGRSLEKNIQQLKSTLKEKNKLFIFKSPDKPKLIQYKYRSFKPDLIEKPNTTKKQLRKENLDQTSNINRKIPFLNKIKISEEEEKQENDEEKTQNNVNNNSEVLDFQKEVNNQHDDEAESAEKMNTDENQKDTKEDYNKTSEINSQIKSKLEKIEESKKSKDQFVMTYEVENDNEVFNKIQQEKNHHEENKRLNTTNINFKRTNNNFENEVSRMNKTTSMPNFTQELFNMMSNTRKSEEDRMHQTVRTRRSLAVGKDKNNSSMNSSKIMSEEEKNRLKEIDFVYKQVFDKRFNYLINPKVPKKINKNDLLFPDYARRKEEKKVETYIDDRIKTIKSKIFFMKGIFDFSYPQIIVKKIKISNDMISQEEGKKRKIYLNKINKAAESMKFQNSNSDSNLLKLNETLKINNLSNLNSTKVSKSNFNLSGITKMPTTQRHLSMDTSTKNIFKAVNLLVSSPSSPSITSKKRKKIKNSISMKVVNPLLIENL